MGSTEGHSDPGSTGGADLRANVSCPNLGHQRFHAHNALSDSIVILTKSAKICV